MISYHCAGIMNGGSGWPSYLQKNNIVCKDFFLHSILAHRKETL